MSLADLIRGNRASAEVATAIPAISATPPKTETKTAARIATVAETSAHTSGLAPLSAEDEAAIREWLALIKETNPVIIAEVLDRCQGNPDARDYYTGRAAAELPKLNPIPHDRRTFGKHET